MREVIHNHIQACPVELGSTDYECGDALEPGHRHHDGVLVGILKCVCDMRENASSLPEILLPETWIQQH